MTFSSKSRNKRVQFYYRWKNVENFFDQTVKHDLRISNNIQKATPGQVYDYITGCSFDYPYFKEHYKMIAIHLSREQPLDDDPKEIQPINFSRILDRDGNTIMFQRSKRNHFRFFTQNSREHIIILFLFNIILV